VGDAARNIQNLLVLRPGHLIIKIPYRSQENWNIFLFDCFVLSLDLCSSRGFLFIRRSFCTLKVIRTAKVRRAQEFLDPVRGKRFLRLLAVQRSGSGTKIFSYPYGMSGAVSTSLKCRGFQTKFEHLQRHSTACHHGCTVNYVFYLTCVTYAVLFLTDYEFVFSKRYGPYGRIIGTVIWLQNLCWCSEQEPALILFRPHFFNIWLLLIPFPVFIYSRHHLVIIEGLIRTTSSNVEHYL
jgi:hypothetical protein